MAQCNNNSNFLVEYNGCIATATGNSIQNITQRQWFVDGQLVQSSTISDNRVLSNFELECGVHTISQTVTCSDGTTSTTTEQTPEMDIPEVHFQSNNSLDILDGLVDEYYTVKAQAHAIRRDLEENKDIPRQELFIQNELLTPSNVVQNIDQALDELYLALIMQDFAYTDAQIDELRTIAEMCPDEGGKSVFTARNLYAHSQEFEIEEYEDLCEEAQLRTNSEDTFETNSFNSTFSLFPNPARDRFEINLGFESIEDVALNIYNSYGQLLQQEKIVSPKQQISTYQLPNGTYIISLTQSGKIIRTERLILIK